MTTGQGNDVVGHSGAQSGHVADTHDNTGGNTGDQSGQSRAGTASQTLDELTEGHALALDLRHQNGGDHTHESGKDSGITQQQGNDNGDQRRKQPYTASEVMQRILLGTLDTL